MLKICLQCRRPGFDPWVGKILWRKEWLFTPVFLPREFHRHRSLVGYNPWGCKESVMTELLTQSPQSPVHTPCSTVAIPSDQGLVSVSHWRLIPKSQDVLSRPQSAGHWGCFFSLSCRRKEWGFRCSALERFHIAVGGVLRATWQPAEVCAAVNSMMASVPGKFIGCFFASRRTTNYWKSLHWTPSRCIYFIETIRWEKNFFSLHPQQVYRRN